MRRQPDVSVVVSTFQRRDALRRVLESLVGQVVAPAVTYEVIVVDNNSNDGTRELVANYVRRHAPLVRYVFEARQGVSYGRNAGIRAARGGIVAFTDDDNVVTRTWVATIESLLRNHPQASGVGGKVLPEWPHVPPSWLDRRHWSPLAILDYGDRRFFTSARRPLCLLTANLAIRRTVLLDVGAFSPEFLRCQDHDLQLRLWRGGHHILYAPELVAFAPVDPGRMTRRYHRRWHVTHGYYAACLGLEEAFDDRGQLVGRRCDGPRFLGSPGYVHLAAIRHASQWLVAHARREPALAAHHEHRVRYLLSYLRQTAALTRPVRRSLPGDGFSFVRSHLSRKASSVNMSLARLAAAHLVVAILLGWSAWDMATGQEHWPFSPYPMFSSVERSRTLDSLVLRGVTADGDAREVALRDGPMISPFDQCRITTAMQRAWSSSPTRLKTMAADALTRYEAGRERGAHDGPPLRALRVYEAHWTLRADASNVDTPDRMRLIAEADAGASAATGGGF